MSTDTQLQKAIKNARTGVDVVIKDIRARKDYSKKVDLQSAVTALSTYSQNLLNAESAVTLIDSAKDSLRTESKTVTSEILTDLVNSNIAMINMGQLNTNRTIEPTTAKKNNENIIKEQGYIGTLISLLQEVTPAPSPSPPPTEASLDSLTVSGAEKTDSGLYYQFFSKDQTVRILAVTKPNTPSAWAQITWQGGGADFSGTANVRSVPLSTLTSVGTPQTITATVNGKSLSVQVAVVPDILGFDVSNAISDGEAKWSLENDETEPVVVKAVVSPNNSAAYKFLKWTGGEIDRKNPNDRRLVTKKLVSGSNKPLPVSVEINLG